MLSFALFSQHARLKQVATYAIVVSLAICTLGIPLPVAQVAKDGGELYPCMNCSCGCANAEMCWRDCCCYSQEQKIAWAKQNNVTPPDFVVAAEKEERPAAANDTRPSCCSTEKSSCCDTAKSCCETKNPPTAKPTSHSLVMFQALKCQGLGAQWMFLPPFLPLADATRTLELPSFESVATVTALFSSHLSQPTTPPPQVS